MKQSTVIVPTYSMMILVAFELRNGLIAFHGCMFMENFRWYNSMFILKENATISHMQAIKDNISNISNIHLD